jgi:predicted extracellular nuclease
VIECRARSLAIALLMASLCASPTSRARSGGAASLGALVEASIGVEPLPVETEVVISQVYGGGGNAGATLTHDFIELFNPGTAPVSLAGWSVQYAPSTGIGTWQVTPLSGTIAAGGYYLVQEAAGSGGTTVLPAPDARGTISINATAGKVALQVTTTAITGQCPSDGTVDLVGYGAANCVEGLAPAGATSNTTAALRKRGGCLDSDNNNLDVSAAPPLPRNSAATLKSCAPTPASIHVIQGSGPASPMAGQDVITNGVVTGIKTNGFFLQTPDGAIDDSPHSSEGIFVFSSASPAVAVGNEVAVRGTVSEFFGLTQIDSSLPGDVVVTARDAATPTAIVLTRDVLDPAGPPDQLERFEGMRLHAPSLTTVAPTDGFGEIAAVLTGTPRPVREPGIPVTDPVPPDPTSGVPDCCIARFDANPERIFVDSAGLAGMPVLAVTSNVSLRNVTGPLDFTFGAYKLLPEAPPAASPNRSSVPVRIPARGEFTVAGFNVENFSGGEAQRRKAALAVRHLMRSPDVVGLVEVLDQPTLQALADQVNSDAVGANEQDPAYQAVLIPAPAGGTQNVGFLVKTARVRIDAVSQERADDTFVNPGNGLTERLHDRPPLVLRSTVDPLGPNPQAVIVVVNHLRSFIDIDLPGAGGARVRAKRKAQAESVAGLLQELQTLHADIPIVAMGDYNAYEFSDGYTDPIATLKGMPTPDDQLVVDESPDLVDPDFVNLTERLRARERYTFIFEGTPQALDHVLLNTVAASYVQRYSVARGNADFPAPGFANDPTRPERSSDHDMPVAYFRFGPR